MISNLGSMLNLFGLGLIAKSNYIYPYHATAVITIIIILTQNNFLLIY